MAFVYSADIAYVIQLGAYTMNFYYADALVDSITTPYDEDEIFEIHTAQVGDIMWITHQHHAPRKLSRTGTAEFTLEEIEFNYGPFLTRNDLVDPFNLNPTTVECSVTDVGDYGILTASSGIFNRNHVGAIYQLTHPKTTMFVSTTGSSTSSELEAKGNVTFTTRGTWIGTVEVQRNENNAGWETFRKYQGNADRNVQVTWNEKSDNTSFQIVPTPMTVGFKGELLAEETHHTGIVKIIGYGSSTVAAIQVITRIESTAATIRWAEGSWSDFRGWPASVAFFQGRCCYAGALTGSEKTIGAEIEYPTLLGINS